MCHPSQEFTGPQRFIGFGKAVKVIDMEYAQIQRLGMG